MDEEKPVEGDTRSMSDYSDVAPDPLIRFVETFNFKRFVEEHLVPSEESEISDTVRRTAHLLGQTKNGEILFAWNKRNNEGEFITVVGVVSQQMKMHKVVYLHDCEVDICNASINMNKTLLAFTIKQPAYEVDESMYDSYIAEIQPQGRVFTLNIPTPDFRTLQFLHIPQPSPRTRGMSKSITVSQLLVVIPGVLICLCHLKLQQVMIGAVLMEQPKQEILHKNFSWYQWDPNMQWLYYARFEATSSKASMGGKYSLLLSCENFSVANHPLLFTVALPLPYSEYLYSRGTTYFNDPFAFSLPMREKNLQVLYRRDGCWCACLQHCTGEPVDQCEGNKIDYSIYIIHNGYVLYGQVTFPELSPEIAMHVHFMLIGCFVAVYVPDVMLHLLNLRPQVDPCHHLTFGSEHSSFAVVESSSAFSEGALSDEMGSGCSSVLENAPVLSTAIKGSLAGDYDTAIIDCTTSNIYECQLNYQAFFCLFKSTDDPVLKEDLLHLMIVGFRHHGMALSMIEHICQTPLTMWDHKLFAEFIISSSFANVYFDCKRLFAKQLPLTTAETFHGKLSDSGNRVVLKLSVINDFVKQLLVQSDQRLVMATPEELLNYDPTGNQAFEILCFSNVLSQPEYRRIDIKKLPTLEECQRMLDASLSASSRQQRSGKKPLSPDSGTGTGIFSKIATLGRKPTSHSSPSRSTQDPRNMLTFLSEDRDIADQLKTTATNIRERLFMSLTKGLPLRSRNTAYNMVNTYYSELERQCCNLLLVIWQSLGFGGENHPLNNTLCRSPTTKEQILFELLEAYQLALLELGLPLPMGFQTLFIALGYITLEKSLFLQYLRNGVFTPTKKFVELLLEDCDEEEDAEVVFQVFCNLDYGLSEYAFNNWHDPTVEKLEQSSKRADRSEKTRRVH